MRIEGSIHRKYARGIGLLCGLILLLAGTTQAGDVDTLRPAGNAYTDFGYWTDFPSAGDRYEKIDEVSIDDDATYIFDLTEDKYYMWYPTDWSGSGTIDSVKFINYGKALHNGTCRLAILRGYNVEGAPFLCGADTITLTTSYARDSVTFVTDPCPDAAWSTAYLNNNSYGFGFKSIEMTSTDYDTGGMLDSDNTYNEALNVHSTIQFMADSSGDLSSIEISFNDATPTGVAKVALYSDSSNFPKNLLWSSDTLDVVDGWLSWPAGICNIVAGTTYWLSWVQSAQNIIDYKASIGLHKYETGFTYTTAWPEWLDNSWTGSNTHQLTNIAIVNLRQVARETQVWIEVFSTEAAEGQVIIISDASFHRPPRADIEWRGQ